MLFVSFIAGLVFGVGSDFFEKMVEQPLRKSLTLSGSELTIISFGVLMLMASIIVSATGADSSAFWLVIGGMIGAFAIRGFLFSKSKLEERQALKAATDAVKDTADAVGDAVNKATA